MPDPIPESRLAEIEAQWRKAADAIVRLGTERPTWDTVDIVCSHADVPELAREVRRLRAVAVAAEAYRDAEDARDAADAQFGPLAPNSDEDRVRRARAMERDTREALDSALRAAGIGGDR